MAVSGLVITGVLAIVNVCAFDVPPPGLGFTTVTDTVPAVATREAGTVTVSCVEEEDVGVRLVPPKLTTEPEMKLVPVTVNVKSVLPAVAQFGLIEVVVGIGLLMVIISVAVPVPPELVALIETL